MEQQNSKYKLNAGSSKQILQNHPISVNNHKLALDNSLIRPKEINETTLIFDTDYNLEFKQIVKIPLELVVHPQTKKWQFQKSNLQDNFNKMLKIRYKRNQSAERKPEIEQASNINIKKIRERDESKNISFLDKLLEGTGYYAQDQKYYCEKGKVSRTPLRKKPTHSTYENKSQEFIIAINDKIYSTSESPVKSHFKPRTLQSCSPEPRNKNHYNNGSFCGCLEPQLSEVHEKYVEDLNFPEIKVTKTDNVFIGRAQNNPGKVKMIINPNKIILAESKQINRSEYPTELLKLREHDEFKNQMIKGLTSRKNSTLISTIPDLKTQYKNIRNNSPFGIKELKPNLTKLNSKIFCIQQD